MRETIESEVEKATGRPCDLQEGASTFDRNHPASMREPEPERLWEPAGEVSDKIRRRIAIGSPQPDDPLVMLEAAVLLERLRVHVALYRERWIRAEERATSAQRKEAVK